jgi:hypothetical protein
MKLKNSLKYYAARFGWLPRAARRARNRGWNLDDDRSVLELAEASRYGPKLPTEKLRALVAKLPVAIAKEKAALTSVTSAEPADVYEQAIFSLQPCYSRLWRATQLAYAAYVKSPSRDTKQAWSKMTAALAQLMKDVPDVDATLRALLLTSDVNAVLATVPEKNVELFKVFTKHVLKRFGRQFRQRISAALRHELSLVNEQFRSAMQSPEGSSPPANEQLVINDLLAMGADERATHDAYLAAGPKTAPAKQAVYLDSVRALRLFARQVPKAVAGACVSRGEIETRWNQASVSLGALLRAISFRLNVEGINPVDLRVVCDAAIEETFAGLVGEKFVPQALPGEKGSPWQPTGPDGKMAWEDRGSPNLTEFHRLSHEASARDKVAGRKFHTELDMLAINAASLNPRLEEELVWQGKVEGDKTYI